MRRRDECCKDEFERGGIGVEEDEFEEEDEVEEYDEEVEEE
jgi:hypothetical protein